tara:strand:- start:4642 stop:7824 length:3183 start_codon:yes stop_codon:yes gene_type:complete
MAKGFRRQGEWQVGFSQKSISSNVKQQVERTKQLEKRAKEEVAKRVQTANDLKAEEQRITNNTLRVSNYEAQLAAQNSAAIRDFLTNTVPSLAKSGMDAARAEGDADRLLAELEADLAPDDENELDPDDPAAGNYGVIEGRGFDAVGAASDQQLDVTTTANNLATKIENTNDPFAKEKARKVRGIFSGAYTYGYEARDKALKAENFSSYFDNEIKTNTTELLDGDVPFSINDPNLTKRQLAIASNYILGKWTEENRGDFNDVSTAKLLVEPAKKLLNANLKKRFEDIDLEFKARQLNGLDMVLDNALDNIAGSPNLANVLNRYVDLAKPHLKATATGSTGHQAIVRLEKRIEDAFTRSNNPDLLEKRLNLALQEKGKTPMGFRSLSELHPTKFGVIPVTMLKQRTVTSKHQANKQYQNAVVELSVADYLQVQRDLPKEKRATEEDQLEFVRGLIDNNPLVTGDVIEKVSKLFLDPQDEYESVLSIKGKVIDNGGVLTKADIIDPSLDGDAVDAYLEANPKIKIVDKLYPDSEKKDVEDVTKSFKTYLAGLNTSFTIDQYGNVKDTSGTFNSAYNAFLSEIKFNAYKIQAEAEATGAAKTFGEAIREADVAMRGMINQAQDPKFADNKYYIDPSEGGFVNVMKEQNIYPYLEQNNVKNIIETIKAEEKSVSDPIFKDVELDSEGLFNNPIADKIAQTFKVPPYDFAKIQSEAHDIPFDVEAPKDYELNRNKSRYSEGINTLQDLQSKNNTSYKAVNRAFNEFFPMNERTLTEAWKGKDFTSVIRNEMAAPALELDAGQIQIIDGKKYTGHRLIGISDLGQFGAIRKPGEDGTPEGASTYHEGIDVGTTYTEGFHTAFNIKDGTVVANASDSKYGVYLDIQTPDNVIYRFAHLKSYNPNLVIGAKYNGERIGEIGTTGVSNGEHLHFEKIVDGKRINPESDLKLLTIGKRLEPTIGKYPITRRMLTALSKAQDDDNPLKGFSAAKALHRYRQSEELQKETWAYLNRTSWKGAFQKANGDPYMAARYHVAYILRGNMDLYNLPTINAFANKYIHKLRTQGVLE